MGGPSCVRVWISFASWRRNVLQSTQEPSKRRVIALCTNLVGVVIAPFQSKRSFPKASVHLYNSMSVVGVDLGYQNTVIAAAGRGGVDVLMNGSAKRLNP